MRSRATAAAGASASQPMTRSPVRFSLAPSDRLTAPRDDPGREESCQDGALEERAAPPDGDRAVVGADAAGHRAEQRELHPARKKSQVPGEVPEDGLRVPANHRSEGGERLAELDLHQLGALGPVVLRPLRDAAACSRTRRPGTC